MSGHRRVGRAVLVGVLTLVVGLGGWAWYMFTPSKYESQTLVYQPGMSWSPDAQAVADTPPAGCVSDPHPIVGSTVTFDRLGRTMPLESRGLAADGSPATPSDNQGYTLAWFDQGPQVGSAAGHVILTAHTFRYGGALGNDMNRGAMQPGDIIRITDTIGTTVCYSFTQALKINLADYAPDSKVLYSTTGDPFLVVVVCADYPIGDGEPTARMLYYARLLTHA